MLEKPTPTEAEQRLMVPGLRAGHYLCFFGMHVLTPVVMRDSGRAGPAMRRRRRRRCHHALAALAELAAARAVPGGRTIGARYDVGVKYGLLTAQMALALNGRDREEVLARLLELLAQRDIAT